MKKSVRIISKNHKHFRYLFRRYHSDILLTVAFILGMLSGAVCVGNADTSLITDMDFLFISDFQARCHQTVLYGFAASLTANFIFFVCNLLFGLSLWGIVGVPFLIGVKGFGISLTGGYLYRYYGMSGIGFFLLVMLTGYVISALALICQGKYAIRLSKAIFAKIRGTTSHSSQSVYSYIISNSFILIALSVGSMTDALCNTLFAGIFNFT